MYITEIKIKPIEIFTNITNFVKTSIENSKIINGMCFIVSTHTTANIKILEDELLLKQDMQMFLERISPKNTYYAHNDIANRDVPPNERLNGHSHIWSLMFNNSEAIPIIDGKLDLGTWQTIILIDTDLGHGERTVKVVII